MIMMIIIKSLTVIVRSDHPPRIRRMTAEQTNRLSIRWQLPLLACIHLLVLLVPGQLRQYVMDYARLLLQVRVRFHLTRQVLDKLHGNRVLEHSIPDDAHPALHKEHYSLLTGQQELVVLLGPRILCQLAMESE